MVVHRHYARCEEVKPLLDLPIGIELDDSQLHFFFYVNQKDIHGKEGEIIDVLSVNVRHDFSIDIEDLVNDEILDELLEEEDHSITNLKLLIDPDMLERCLGSQLVELEDMFIDTKHLFVNNYVEQFQKYISSQTYNLFNSTDGVTSIYVRLKVSNYHYYRHVAEYRIGHREAVLREIELHNEQVDGYEDELFQSVQTESMEVGQPTILVGASGASIGALETTKYRSEECSEITCSVCYEEFMTDEEIKKMPCSSAHIFHTDCIEKWLKINHVCPVCRYRMPTDE